MENHKKIVSVYSNATTDAKINLLPTIIGYIVFEKEFYKSNDDLREFTGKYLGLNFKDYVFRSRTLLYSRIVKECYFKNDALNNLSTKIDIFLKDKSNSHFDHKKKTTSPSQIDIINGWRKVIDSNDD